MNKSTILWSHSVNRFFGHWHWHWISFVRDRAEFWRGIRFYEEFSEPYRNRYLDIAWIPTLILRFHFTRKNLSMRYDVIRYWDESVAGIPLPLWMEGAEWNIVPSLNSYFIHNHNCYLVLRADEDGLLRHLNVYIKRVS